MFLIGKFVVLTRKNFFLDINHDYKTRKEFLGTLYKDEPE